MSTNSIYNLEYFNFLGLAQADKNKNGDIDDDEKSIFDNFMKQFDMNKNGKLEEEDALLYRQSVEFTDDEKNAQKEAEEFLKSYGIDSEMSTEESKKAISYLPKEEQKRFSDILARTGNYEKRMNNYNDSVYQSMAIKYLLNLSSSICHKILFRYDCVMEIIDKLEKKFYSNRYELVGQVP